MSASLEQLKSTLSGLSTSDRAELAQFLLGTLDPEEDEAKDCWPALAERRMKEVRAGGAVGVPSEEVLKSLTQF